MSKIFVDYSINIGKIKPMHAVNNGPVGKTVRGETNSHYFTEAGIPYARLHDSAFFSGYGGEFSVDVHRIFRDFNADPTLPESYIFGPTDKYLADIAESGTNIYYRLGAAIEHGYKHGTYPPSDFKKWAVICEHIIKHYTQGWANGFHYHIEYWEIWNEPDCANHDSTNPCWQGTEDEFIEFFVIALKHLKECFPNLKIGGPSFTGAWKDEYTKKLLTAIKENNLQLDFYSFHGYAKNPAVFGLGVQNAKKHLQEKGFDKTELHLNEWNYVKGWLDDNWRYSIRAQKSLKGASFIAASMCVCQRSDLDMLMYYDARPCKMNGMFDSDTYTVLKGYYPFKMFNSLYVLGQSVKVSSDDETIYACAAKNDKEYALMVSYFDDDDSSADKDVVIHLDAFKNDGARQISFYLLDEQNDMRLLRTETVCSQNVELHLNLKLFDTYLITVK